MTIEVKNMPLSAFVSLVATKTGVSIVADKDLTNSKVTLSVSNMDTEDIISLCARQMETEYTRTGELFYIGKMRESDNAFFVSFFPRFDKDETERALSALISSSGKLSCYQDGLVLVSDNTKSLAKIAKLLDSVKKSTTNSWIIQYQFIAFRYSDLNEIGLTANANFNLSTASAGDSVSSAEIGALLNKALKQNKAKLISQPLLVLENGFLGRLSDGEEVPIPQKTVSSEGTVTTTGVSYKNTGPTIEATVRDMGNGATRLLSDITINQIEGYNGDYPIVKGQNLTFQTAIDANKTYLVASISQNYETQSRGREAGARFNANARKDSGGNVFSTFGNFSFGKSRNEESTDYLLQIWVRAYRIADMVRKDAPIVIRSEEQAPEPAPPIFVKQEEAQEQNTPEEQKKEEPDFAFEPLPPLETNNNDITLPEPTEKVELPEEPEIL